ncbi:MAG: gliding motility-associated C-terminal domain-containing protein [Paludibacter sp.]|nr:gliding motility-associated C-terminal domain-containing protein [Bacteroidales bacterium]MCM1068901.1 gliding motility-associated C-terminal domain-containing protein [Prevotella sp.]MCM1353162.1 gliding motility-associated C-terminal domain-containing protein [Bacteroides sp.]MCM1442484.1 gliding motility-associated C-terminal domain-containing protein [Muribaculum sp.]MCM1481327.1 gliding motility-associated C-terminal domain-containing protein [Paludibacter sp.]
MKKRLFVILLICCPLLACGEAYLSVSGGNVCLLPQPKGIDYVFIFAGLQDAELHTTDANPVWWQMQNGDSVCIAQGVDYLLPEDNTGYILHTDQGRVTFWVIDYLQYQCQIRAFTVDMQYDDICTNTRLLLDADIPALSYETYKGVSYSIERECEVHYMSLGFTGEVWEDSACVETLPLRSSLVVPAPLQNTVFTLSADQFAQQLGLLQDSVTTDVYNTVALAVRPQTITTIRGTESDNKMSNEVDRPTEATVLNGSAPLDILFRANGTPAAAFYQWRLYRGSDLLAQRTDAEHRYTFDTYGEYRVVLTATNDFCATDSTEFKVSVSESQLLVPNVFTPNGDGQNDEFRVLYRSITEFRCWVYNRWGKKVFEWTDPAKGWDGTINGKKAAESAYFYVIRAKGADGRLYKLKGDINLIRGK